MSTIGSAPLNGPPPPHTKICEIPSADFFFEMFFVLNKAILIIFTTSFMVWLCAIICFMVTDYIFGMEFHKKIQNLPFTVKYKIEAFLAQREINKNRKKKK